MIDAKKIDEIMAAYAPEGARSIMEALDQAGRESFLVGGCVRDVIRGVAPHDWDITTSATPAEMKAAVPLPSYDTGIEHGTVIFLFDGEPFEVTTFRMDGEYVDGRHPSTIEFADSVEYDLARRDFSVNALAWSPHRGLIDPHGGLHDLSAGVLRAVGDPEQRFSEDGLRVMRAVRFAATQRLEVEQATADAMRTCVRMLDLVAVERLEAELMKTLSAKDGRHLRDVIDEFKEIIFAVLPELAIMDGYDQANPNHDRDLWHHDLDVMAALPPDPRLRLAGLLHDIGKPTSREVDQDGVAHYCGHMEAGATIAEGLCRRLRMPNDATRRIAFLVSYHDLRPQPTAKSARRFLVRMGSDEMASDMLRLMEADIRAHSPEATSRGMEKLDAAREIIEQEQAASLAMKVSDLAIGGADLIGIGYEPGPEIGCALSEMFALVVDGEVENDAWALMRIASSIREDLDRGVARVAPGGHGFIREDGREYQIDI